MKYIIQEIFFDKKVSSNALANSTDDIRRYEKILRSIIYIERELKN